MNRSLLIEPRAGAARGDGLKGRRKENDWLACRPHVRVKNGKELCTTKLEPAPLNRTLNSKPLNPEP
jgi:hypothetical protein